MPGNTKKRNVTVDTNAANPIVYLASFRFIALYNGTFAECRTLRPDIALVARALINFAF